MNAFAGALLAWFARHGRHDLPWQHPRDAYRVWVSEIMLQQTQVSTVIRYFERFIAALPDLRSLAAASEDEVFALWSGLGYYRRARFLRQAAQRCVERHGGELPRDFAALAALPGIGRSTAGAILAQACGLRFPILDGNVKRVLARYHGIQGYPGTRVVEQQLWRYADEHTPTEQVADYTQAIMDLGATVCTRSKPCCAVCPLAANCIAYRDGRVEELPTRKPGKSLPERETAMLILRDDAGRILLERRGPQGVWAGLWSLPEAAGTKVAASTAAGLASVAAGQPLPAFVHTFTHYRLHVTPWLYERATPRSIVADAPNLRWYDAEAVATLGLPAPVRRLLLQVIDGH
jgi:A/G-specific adenine glycosylase